jgi:hypothetical protein
MGGGRSGLRAVRIALLVAVLLIGLALHHHGSVYNTVHYVYFVIIIGIIAFSIFMSRTGRGGFNRSGRGGPGGRNGRRNMGGPDISGGNFGGGSFGTPPSPRTGPSQQGNADPEAGEPPAD